MKIDSTRRGERPEHAAHDQLLVARFAAGDVTDAEADAARSQVATCSDCRLLASDLLAIAHATADLPAPARARDFRLTPERAAALRRPAAINWLSRVVGSGAASGRLLPLQRLAAAVVAIGLVMGVVTSPAGIPGSSTSSGSSKTAAPASETRAAAAPGLALAPNAAAPSSAAPFPASGARPTASPAAAAAMAAASPTTASVQVPLAAPSAAQLVGVGRAPTAAPPITGRPVPSAPAAPGTAAGPSSTAAAMVATVPSPPAAPALAAGPSSTAQAPLAATVPSAPQGELGASSEPFGPWQAWLVVAAAGVLVLLVVRLSSRRPT